MSDTSIRNMDGSQDSLRQAVGRLDAVSLGEAPGGQARRLRVRLSGRWLLLLLLVAVSVAAVSSLLAA
jgi:hypothetical protein